MERSLVLFALVAGFALWLGGAAAARRNISSGALKSALPVFYPIASLVVAMLVFLVTIPSSGRFFSPGHDLGNGYLLGALGALLSGVVLSSRIGASVKSESPSQRATYVASPFALGLSGVAASLLIKHDTLWIGLLGLAIGWTTTTGLLLFGMMQSRAAEVGQRPEPLAIVAGAGFCALLSAAVALGEQHGSAHFYATSNLISYGVIALAIAVAIPLSLMLSPIGDLFMHVDRRDSGSVLNQNDYWNILWARGIRAVAALIAVGAIDRAVCMRLVNDAEPATGIARLTYALVGASPISHAMAEGTLLGLLIWWICSSIPSKKKANEVDPHGSSSQPTALVWQKSGLAVIVLMMAVMAAYQQLLGFGISLLLLGSYVAVTLSILRAFEPERVVHVPEGQDLPEAAQPLGTALQMTLLGIAATLLVLYRVYVTYYGDPVATAFTDQYASFGTVIGIAFPFFLSGLLTKCVSKDPEPSALKLIRCCVCGLVLLATPALMLLLWGEKTVIAFLIALAISAALSTATGLGITLKSQIVRLFPAVIALGVSLAVCEWSHYLLNMEDWTRLQKERVVVQVVATMIALVVGSEYVSRFAAARFARASQSEGSAR